MKRFIEGTDRQRFTMLLEFLDDYIAEDNTVLDRLAKLHETQNISD